MLRGCCGKAHIMQVIVLITNTDKEKSLKGRNKNLPCYVAPRHINCAFIADSRSSQHMRLLKEYFDDFNVFLQPVRVAV